MKLITTTIQKVEMEISKMENLRLELLTRFSIMEVFWGAIEFMVVI